MAKNQIREFAMFCYVCKKPVTVRGESKKEATGLFQKLGHYDQKTKALAPNLGRTSLKYLKAVTR